MWKSMWVGHITLLFMGFIEVYIFDIIIDKCWYQSICLFHADGLNISSSQSQPQVPDNLTIQNFVKDYVDEYVGRLWLAT